MMNETAQQNMENHPVIRTLYDHVDEVTCLAFHPTEQILASGSRDYTLKLFDYSKPSAKRAFKYIQVRTVWKGASFFFFLKYSELMCDSSLPKNCLSGRPVNNKEDALPAPGGTVLVLSGASFLWPLRTACGQRDGSELTSLFKGCRFLLKGKT